MIIKRIPKIQDWLIPFILTACGIIICILMRGEITGSVIVQGILVTAVAVLANQYYSQANYNRKQQSSTTTTTVSSTTDTVNKDGSTTTTTTDSVYTSGNTNETTIKETTTPSCEVEDISNTEKEESKSTVVNATNEEDTSYDISADVTTSNNDEKVYPDTSNQKSVE